MALSGAVLKSLIVQKVEAATGNDIPAIAENVWQAVADAIVEHFQTAAIVNSTVAVTSVSGVTAGAAVSGPGAGTAVGTIS